MELKKKIEEYKQLKENFREAWAVFQDNYRLPFEVKTSVKVKINPDLLSVCVYENGFALTDDFGNRFPIKNLSEQLTIVENLHQIETDILNELNRRCELIRHLLCIITNRGG